MSEQEHTPAPWRVGERRGGRWIDVCERDDRAMVAQVCTDRFFAEANARLIAAAPALLDVVRRIRGWDHLDGAGDGAFWKGELDAALLAAVGEGK